MKVASPVPGRQHKMVRVDFSNAFLRNYFPRWLEKHEERLGLIADQLPAWKAEAAAGGETRPPAIVLDIDEVLLCNLHYNQHRDPGAGIAFHAGAHFSDPRTGAPWAPDHWLNPAMPGAEGLLRAARDHGIKVFMVTGRLEHLRGETVDNFEYLGWASDEPGALLDTSELRDPEAGTLYLCPPAEALGSMQPYKQKRRARIAETHRILLNAGDQASDLGLYGDVQYLLQHPFYFIH